MSFEVLKNKEEIEKFLRKDTDLHIYCIGDLDDFFWEYTTWYGLRSSKGKIEAIILLYTGFSTPTILALSNDFTAMSELLFLTIDILPDKFYAHLSPNLENLLDKKFKIQSFGLYNRMMLKNENYLSNIDICKVINLDISDLPVIEKLYKDSFPGNWFDKRMLESKQYFGIMDNDKLISIAGIHVYSKKYKVSALGNITTHPDFRSLGYGKMVSARLCKSLLDEGMECIGLNVKANNPAAISSYKKIGFEKVVSYNEFMVERKKKKN